VHRFLTWILILHTLHAPVFMPDMDGECRGAPIESLIENQAWHPVLLGVRPNNDIDRGPIRTDDEQESSFDGSQFGDLAILTRVSANSISSAVLFFVAALHEGFRVEGLRVFSAVPSIPPPVAGRSVCVCYCIWRI
jgi:hypothetical protein